MATRKRRKRSETAAPATAASRWYQRVQDAYPLLTAGQERELFHTLANGDEDAQERVRETLMLSNFRLVAKNAKRLAYGVPFEDLVQVGFIGLMRAIDKFEVERGHKFSTYATWWIRQAITRARPELAHIIHVPEWVVVRERAVHRAAEEYRAAHGAEPDAGDLAEAVGITAEQVDKAQRDIENASLWSSLDAQVSPDGNSPRLAEMLVDPFAEDPAERVEHTHDATRILGQLEEREEHIISERFGVGREDEEGQHLRDIGKQLGVSGERVRQIEAEAMEALRDTYSRDTVGGTRILRKKRKAAAAKQVVTLEEAQRALFG